MPNTLLGRSTGLRVPRLPLLLAAVLLLAIAAACGGGDDEEEVVEPEPTPTQAPIPTATPFAATPEPTVVGGGETATVTPAATPRTEVTYRVEPGDTLSAIAQRFGTTVQALMAVNEIADPTLIFAGQDLTIPGEGAPTGTPAPTGDGGGDGGGVSSYVVQPGDTASAIADRFGVTLAALAEANETTVEELGLIFVGQELALPRPP